jgi:hypothetical protein
MQVRVMGDCCLPVTKTELACCLGNEKQYRTHKKSLVARWRETHYVYCRYNVTGKYHRYMCCVITSLNTEIEDYF